MEFYCDVSVADVFNEMSDIEKKEMYERLKEFYADAAKKPEAIKQVDIVDELRKMTRYSLKKVLCDALYISSYNNESGMRTEFEKIIKAR